MLHVSDRTDDRVTAGLPETVDLYTTPGLRAVGDRIIDEGCLHLTLDASHTAQMDSTGITMLITWYQRLERLGGTMSVTDVPHHLYDLLLRLGLDSVMTITPHATTTDAPSS
ncbi:STAS domain-containing protein [Streptomyces sp. NPDC040750]|uniref:STAS domain-containing protein n=1 Tax=Streptomyces sp. NPDC040750 TaxID=3154491 RepID=UPI0033F7D424